MFCQWISGRARLVGWGKCQDCVLSGMSSYMTVSAGIFIDVLSSVGASGQWELFEDVLVSVGKDAVDEDCELANYYFWKCNSITTNCSGSVEKCTFVGFLVRFLFSSHFHSSTIVLWIIVFSTVSAFGFRTAVLDLNVNM